MDEIKTLVELYDSDCIRNVIIPMILKPDRVIYICTDDDCIEPAKNLLWNFFGKYCKHMDLQFIVLDPTEGREVDTKLDEIRKTYKNVAFELTGGADILIAQVGGFCDQYGITQIYKDFDDNQIVYMNGKNEERQPLLIPIMTLEDVIQLCGGKIIGQFHHQPSSSASNHNACLKEVCQLFFKNRDRWARFVYCLQQIPTEDLYAKGPRVYKQNNHEVKIDENLLIQLEEIGVISQLDCTKDTSIQFCYDNEIFKELLLIQGIWLELYVYFTAKEDCKFNDVRMSTMIEWTPNDDEKLRNEIDILLLKGEKPIFISCKMTAGPSSVFALYEIKMLCEKFGGGEAEAVLITADDVCKKQSNLFSRAGELGMYIFDINDLRSGNLANCLNVIG